MLGPWINSAALVIGGGFGAQPCGAGSRARHRGAATDLRRHLGKYRHGHG